MNRVAIVGVGLIGTSFALALKKAGFAGEIWGVSSERSVSAAMKAGAVARHASLAEAARHCDLIYLSQPIEHIIRTLEKLGPLLRPGCLVTDAGSTKAQIVRTANDHLPTGSFLGGHPMAGKERRGAEAAEADLFRNRPYVLTPITHNELTRNFGEWLTRIGSNVIELTPEQHDMTVALTSHLPQLVSTTLAFTLQQKRNPHLGEVFGPGLLDMTRLALSAPEVWMSVLHTNKPAVLAAIQDFRSCLDAVEQQLQDGELSSIFRQAAEFATHLRSTSN